MTVKTTLTIDSEQLLSEEMSSQLDKEFFGDFEEEEGQEEERCRVRKSVDEKRIEFNQQSTDAANAALKLMATLSVLRPAKFGNLYLFEAGMFLYLARQHFLGASLVVEEAAEVLGVSEEQCLRFIENMGEPGIHVKDLYLATKSEGKRRRDGDDPLLKFEPFDFITKSKVKKVRHVAHFTDFGKRMAVDACSFSLLNRQT